MLITKKIRLKPTTEQEILFRKSAGVSRWAYNFFLGENKRIYREYIDNGKVGKKSISEGDVRKYINNVLKPTTHSWLKEVGSNVMKQGVKDANLALQRYFKDLSGKPKFKSKHKDRPSFYVNYESLSRKQGGFQGEKIGFVKTSESLPKLNKNEKYSNINKTQRVKNLEKKLKREQRKLSRKIENNIQSYKSNRSPVYKRPLKECQNVQKQNRLIRNIHRKLANIRQNYLHQTTTEIVKTKPSRIVMESLNVSEMMKNKHLSKAIQQQKFYEFKRQIEYKSKLNGIEFIQVDKFYPSSKTCSCCGNIKKDLKLSDRMYKCDVCGLVIDRDYNASINLANYEVI